MYSDTVATYKQIYGVTFQPPTFEEWLVSCNQPVTLNPQYASQPYHFIPTQQCSPQQPTQINQQCSSHQPTQMHQQAQVLSQTRQQTIITSQSEGSRESNWGAEETRILVHAWRDKYAIIQSPNSDLAWTCISTEVNKSKKASEQKRGVESCKAKIKRLKMEYNTAKDNNSARKTGTAAIFPKFYDIFDELLSTRDTTTRPFLDETGKKGLDQTRASKRKSSGSKFDTFLEKTMKMMEDSEIRQEKFLERFFDKQAEMEKKERELERKQGLELAKLFALRQNKDS